MRKYRFGNKQLLLVVIIVSFITSANSSFSMYLISQVTNAASDKDMVLVYTLIKTLLIVVGLSLIFELILTTIQKAYLKQSMIELRLAYSKRLFNLNLLDYNVKNKEAYLSNLVNDMSRIESSRYLMMLQVIFVVMRVITSLLLLLTISVQFLIVGLIMFSFSLYTTSKTSKQLEDQEKIKSSSMVRYTNYIKESLLGFYIIKQNKLENSKIEEFKIHANTIAQDNFNLDRKSTHVDAINNAIQVTVTMAIVIGGLLISRSSGTSIGTIVLVGTAFMQSMWPMQQVMPYIATMNSVNILFDQFDEVLAKSEDLGVLTLNEVKAIKFNNASLGYSETAILNDVNIVINQNEKVLIVGKSGEGKSTILKSIRRQLIPLAGTLHVNDLDVQKILADDYYSKFSIVDQIGFIFNGTLKDNVTMYTNSDDEVILKILAQTGLSDLALDYELSNNGSNISGGQRARLLLARSLFLDSEVIIGDEIFAALNRSVGSNIEKVMLTLDKTIINVSHIIYEENFELYDKVYLVNNHEVKRLNSFDDLRAHNIILFK